MKSGQSVGNAGQKYKLLIFDWDGTLMDSSERIVRCMHQAALSFQLPLADPAAIRDIIGLSLEIGAERLYPGLSDEQFSAFVAEFRRQSLGNEIEACQLFDGVKLILQSLSERGYYLSVATGKSRRGLDQDFRKHGMEGLFPISRTGDEAFSKPHPLMLEEILTDYNLDVDVALMIGDTEYDLQMAANAGMDSLAVSYGVHSAERLLAQRPQGLIERFDQLPDWLNK
uniref:Similar to phosphoglycolate phosphatase, clustered with ribosomal large subunit pseudouridine synthase C n=1 Tax=uncultured Thiotrichaceae bacterium TaxID=298394 RepID=A0A6S6T5S1_9GAMM|nr:MAG: Similar to phosphoglycolate phosphatase, clustered with ribosomal large subunit pseudouridine synthase C [uncultured Thiotrichaceae bacterium]